MASDIELAWAAGFFDGEGSTSVLKAARDKYSYLRVSLSQKEPELLHKFAEIVGCGKVYKAGKREIYSWDCYRKDQVNTVLELLWPFLGDKKRKQAEDARKTVAENTKQ